MGTNERNTCRCMREHLFNKAKFPTVSVAGDLVLNGERVLYGTRIYFSSYPDIVFRIVDTGGNFFGTGKKDQRARL